MFDSIFPKHWTTLQRLMWLKTNALARAVYETITGNPVSFTAKAAPLKQLKVEFSPVQSGSGDPSPDNVRPISGWDSVNIWVQPTHDTTAEPTATIQLGETIYGGTLDLVTGVVTVDHVSETYNGTEAWGREVLLYDTARFFLWKNEMKKYVDYTYSPYILFSNRMPTVKNYSDFAKTTYLAVTGYSITSNPDNYLYVMSHYAATGIETVDQLKAWLAENPLQVCYELATPIPIQLTPQEVESLAGDNTMWSNANQPITVTYRSN